MHSQGIEKLLANDLRAGADDRRILAALHAFPHDRVTARTFVSLAILFPETPSLGEREFEVHLWKRLNALHALDAEQFDWDPAVSEDPSSPDFGMSFGGHGFYVIGMHPGASRKSRRTPTAALVFNAHAQFRLLRDVGQFDGIKRAVRARDIRLQGSANPMLADHGDKSEASQYAGRRVEADWACPFRRATH